MKPDGVTDMSERNYFLIQKQDYGIDLFLFSERGSFYIWGLNYYIKYGDIYFKFSKRKNEMDVTNFDFSYSFDRFGDHYTEKSLREHALEVIKEVGLYELLLDKSLSGFDKLEIDMGTFQYVKKVTLEEIQNSFVWDEAPQDFENREEVEKFVEVLVSVVDILSLHAKEYGVDISESIEEMNEIITRIRNYDVGELLTPYTFDLYTSTYVRNLKCYDFAYEFVIKNTDELLKEMRKLDDYCKK